MQAIKNFLKNKSPYYYVVFANAVLALIGAILFFATYVSCDAMANNAAGNVPETIGIYLLAGFVAEAVVLVLPQYKIIHLVAVIFFGASLSKEIFLIPNLIADRINNVAYQGGNLELNIVYIVIQFAVMISSIVVAFNSLFANEADEAKEFVNVKGKTQLIKLAAGSAALVVAILTSTLVSANLQKKSGATGGVAGGQTSSDVDDFDYDPITDDIKAIAEAYDYDFDPDSVVIQERETWDFSDPEFSSISTSSGNREGRHLVYYFEGSYSEGWQGDYSESYAYLYLWDDGYFAGKSKNDDIKGFWYNSSLTAGVDEEGNPVVDCLNMVSNTSNYKSIITEKATGFYDKQAYIFIAPWGGGQRSVVISGYKYYPEVALFIDANNNGKPLEYKVGQRFSTSTWTANRVLKNLSYAAVFKSAEVRWTIPSELNVGESGRLQTAGEYEVKATWNNLEATVKVVVSEE